MSTKNDHIDAKVPEILAPVGDYDALVGAIKGGADAVYLGVGDFNARQGAKNFTSEDLENAIDMAHSHGIRVFLALNVPIKQNEMQDALDLVDKAYSYGIDAIILEDLGLFRILKATYPDLELHTSTQMTIHNKEGVDFVEDLGASRVILSRELNTKQVKDIVDSSNVGIELFMHGALCYSYSGRCLFSSFLGSRSANRGACSQPCRRRYDLKVNGRKMNDLIGGDYVISCAELSTISGLDEIVNAGVESLKIEGRMKKPEYVTKTASAYKTAVENICINGTHLGEDEIAEKEKELAQMFYRGFTKGFILDDKDVTHPKYSSNYGVFLGKVLEMSTFRYSTNLTVELNEDIHVRDGIGIHTKSGMLGSSVNAIISETEERLKSAKKGEKVELEISAKTGKAVQIGDEVHLTMDTKLMEELQNVDLKKLPLDIKITARLDENLKVEIKGADGSAEFVDEYVVQAAQKAPTTNEKITDIVKKLGETPYFAENIDIDADEDIFIPVGVLTNARRSAADILLQKAISAYKKERKNPDVLDIDDSCAGQEKDDEDSDTLLLSVEVNDIRSLFKAAEAGADIIYIPIECFSQISDAGNEGRIKELKDEGVEIVFITPQITFDHEISSLTPLIETVKSSGFNVSCSNLGTIQLAKSLEIPFVVQKELNTFNSFTCNTFYNSGAYRVTLSSELNLDEIENVCDSLESCGNAVQAEVLVHGRELLLITEHDLLKPLVDKNIIKDNSEVVLVDRKDSKYPVKRLGTRTLIYNSRILNMLDNIDELEFSGVDVLRLDLSFNSDKEVENITNSYKKALSGRKAYLKAGRDEVYSQGHYFKGV